MIAPALATNTCSGLLNLPRSKDVGRVWISLWGQQPYCHPLLHHARANPTQKAASRWA